MKKPIVDLHCHPAMKPFGKSFMRRYITGENNPNTAEENSIWHQQRPKLFRRVANVLLSLTKWRQSDMETLIQGDNRVIVASLYPLEKGMVVHHDAEDIKFAGRLLRNLATGIGMRRIRHLQEMKDYFTDLVAEYDFYKQLHGKTVTLNGKQKTYKMIGKSADLELEDENCVNVIMSIEGAHVFNCGLEKREGIKTDREEVLQNLQKVKNWEFRPLFIGIAHHFDNGLCGFAESFSGIVAKQMKQADDPEQGFSELGIQVVMDLLDNSDGKRILPDIKHMNPKSRYEYYDLLKKRFPEENIPIVVSHGALNGKLRYKTHDYVSKKGFNAKDINFFFDELILIEKSKGIFGIQLDERRIFDVKMKRDILKEAKKNMNNYGKRHLRHNSYFIWRQIETIGVYLDNLGHNAWSIQALGTDYDGIINPLNGWWTSKELKDLDQYLMHHALDFLSSDQAKSLKEFNKLSAEEIVEKVMSTNALDFIKRNF
jgi:hypothetical protein